MDSSFLFPSPFQHSFLFSLPNKTKDCMHFCLLLFDFVHICAIFLLGDMASTQSNPFIIFNFCSPLKPKMTHVTLPSTFKSQSLKIQLQRTLPLMTFEANTR